MKTYLIPTTGDDFLRRIEVFEIRTMLPNGEISFRIKIDDFEKYSSMNHETRVPGQFSYQALKPTTGGVTVHRAATQVNISLDNSPDFSIMTGPAKDIYFNPSIIFGNNAQLVQIEQDDVQVIGTLENCRTSVDGEDFVVSAILLQAA